jgi:putative DeoR family transcriptional regulator, stage III sporulation protein D
MDEYITERVVKIAYDILYRKETIRNIATLYGVSKSTVHKDLSERLNEIDAELYEKVRELLDYNKSVRHLRGGNSTKLKYLKKEK